VSLDHLGIAVKSIAAALPLYTEGLGLEAAGEPEEVPSERVRLVMLPVGSTRLELLESTAADGPIARFIERFGEGIHHVAVAVDDLEAVAARLRGRGVRLVYDEIRVGAGGHRFIFVHPKSAGGVLLELVEARAGEANHGGG